MSFRCSAASADDAEPLAGTAPTDARWLFVEYAGAWGRNAVTDSRLPTPVRDHLAALDDVRVQLIRRPATRPAAAGHGIHVFSADLSGTPRVGVALVDALPEIAELHDDDFTAYDAPLWFVCTNGARDLCCAEVGRPIASALAQRWPADTWETTHLGGHRFSGTLLALPSAVTLGRLNAAEAVTVAEQVLAGATSVEHHRGRAGWPARAQVAALHATDGQKADSVVCKEIDGDTVFLEIDGDLVEVDVRATAGEPRRQSCVDDKTKPTTVYTATERR